MVAARLSRWIKLRTGKPRWRRRGFLFAYPLRINPEFDAFLDKSSVGLPGVASIRAKGVTASQQGLGAGALERNALPGGAGPAQLTPKTIG
jgi:hypothetical protein